MLFRWFDGSHSYYFLLFVNVVQILFVCNLFELLLVGIVEFSLLLVILDFFVLEGVSISTCLIFSPFDVFSLQMFNHCILFFYFKCFELRPLNILTHIIDFFNVFCVNLYLRIHFLNGFLGHVVLTELQLLGLGLKSVVQMQFI